ncbi:MAG: inorganic phosphate transporter [Thermoanaerobaculia bacterium]
MIAAALVLVTLGLAFANGANDVSKCIATLVGSGVTNYRRAVIWGSICTAGGAVAAGFLTQALVSTFNGKGLLTEPLASHAFLLAVACGAAGWLIVATRTGLPVSTTHSLAGALVGTALVAVGAGGIAWSAVLSKIALPLLLSPAIAVLLLIALLPLLRPFVERFDRYCVCVESAASQTVTPDGIALRQSLPGVQAGSQQECTMSVARFGVADTLHWISSGAASFFRGVNDAPKVLAIGVAAGALVGLSSIGLYALVAAAMGAGSLIAGFRVTRTLAERVTTIEPANGLAANVVTALLVGVASRFALPVSTTHVSTGAIVGVGLSREAGSVRWKTVREMLLAWIVTLPASAILAAVAYEGIRFVS